jgi:hypothetical protein
MLWKAWGAVEANFVYYSPWHFPSPKTRLWKTWGAVEANFIL